MAAARWSDIVSTVSAVVAFLISIVMIWMLWPGNERSDFVEESSGVSIPIADSNVRGNRSALVALVEFSDFQCPYCSRFASDLLPEILKKYVQTGEVAFVFRHFPLRSIHRFAESGAAASECAAIQGKFWEFHDALFASPLTTSGWPLEGIGSKVGLDLAAFGRCVAAEGQTKVQRDFELGTRLRIGGTPTFFVGSVDQGGEVRRLTRLVGAPSQGALFAAINRVLKRAR